MKGLYKMSRKRLTQILPFLLPLRQKQRKLYFYTKMHFDSNKYAKYISDEVLPYKVYETESLMLNYNSGFDMEYQINKVHNLKLAAKTIDKLIIKPSETFSFWQLVRFADRYQPYKTGLNLVGGKIMSTYGGGLCQISTMLYWMFLHTPLTIVERHGHAVEAFPSTTKDLPEGTDATIGEGWLDLKVKNNTQTTFQITISFDDEYMFGSILSDLEPVYEYEIFNENIIYFKKGSKVFQMASVDCNKVDKLTGQKKQFTLYDNICEIGYELPDKVQIIEKGE